MINGQPVLYVVEGKKTNGCNFYRLHQPYKKILEKDIFPCAISTELTSPDDQETWLDRADVIVTQIGTSEKFLDFVLENRDKRKFILDFDDNIFNVSPYNPAYKDVGTEEVEVEIDGEKKKLWEHGKDGFNLAANRARLFIFSETLKAVDIVTTPSSVLSGTFKKAGAKKTRVIKNLVDLSVWNKLKVEKDGFIRIGYQGGWSHYEDWYEISGVLKEVMEKYPKTVLVICGQAYDGFLKDLPQDRVQKMPWVSIDAYPWMFKTMNIDIGIAPLSNTAFNTCKSEIKWEEYSSLEIPCIASLIPPYSLSMADGKTGFLAQSKEEWKYMLSKLIESEDLRKNIGQAARKEIEETYSLDKEIVQYKGLIDSLFNRELVICK